MIYKSDLTSFKINNKKKITEALKKLNLINPPILFVVDKKDNFIGTVTDGDIRRHFLNENNLNLKIEKIVNKKPFVCNFKDKDKKKYYRKILYSKYLKGIPIIKSKKLFAAFFALEEKFSSPILIMAGGKGKRLLPLTKNIPKPLLKLNGKPILEYIVDNIIKENFYNIYVSINYKSKKIKNFFKINKNFGLNVNFLEEKKPLGTAGSLFFLKKRKIEDKYIIVINGDVITDLKLNKILSFHKENNFDVTMGCMNYQTHIPFGVIKNHKGKFDRIEEKPYINKLVNAGIYVLNKSVVKKIKSLKFTTMLDLIEKINKKKVGLFQLYENEDWIDLGNKSDFLKIKKKLNN